jgi:DNA (cytosine-5)-methyltransferase 1
VTPLECERLQGFPEGHTLVPYLGTPAEDCPDSFRYKALGNSMAVPVMHWIGTRVDAVRNGQRVLADVPAPGDVFDLFG